jgi:hypothetical protein
MKDQIYKQFNKSRIDLLKIISIDDKSMNAGLPHQWIKCTIKKKNHSLHDSKVKNIAF